MIPDWLIAPEVSRLFATFTAAGEELRLVGGCVRDYLMGRAVGEIDAATPAPPERVTALLEAAGIRVIPTGLKHGTVTALIEAQSFEITTLREDAACDGRHAEVRFTDDWQKDAARRDFTVNALFMDATGRIFDYFGGREDLAARRIRFIGDPAERIREDYLRILRFFRFFATHAAPPPDEAALAACRAEAAGIRQLSGERIRQEMFKLFSAPDPLPALHLMEACGVWQQLAEGEADRAALERLLALHPCADVLLRLAVALQKSAVATLATRWRLSHAERERLEGISSLPVLSMQALGEKEAKALIRRYGAARVTDWLWYAAAREGSAVRKDLLELAAQWQPPVFPLTGKDLLAAGIPAGKAMGHTLKALEAAWEAADYQPTREELLADALRMVTR